MYRHLIRRPWNAFFRGEVDIKSSEKIVTFIILYQKANNIEMYHTMMKRAQDKLSIINFLLLAAALEIDVCFGDLIS